MLNLTYPGIYTKEEQGVPTLVGAPTSVALFVGPTLSGIDNRRTRIFNFGDFQRSFGGLTQTSNLSYSVLHFFANGGGQAYVLRVPANNAVPAATQLKRNAAGNNAAITLTALSSGAASSLLFFEIDQFGIGADPFGANPDPKRFNLTIIDPVTGKIEKFKNLTTSSSGARFASKVVNDDATGSQFVKLDVTGIDKEAPQATGSIYKLKALPTANFGSDITLDLTVAVRNAAGADDAGSKVSLAGITIFAKNDPAPRTALELAAKLQSALNAAIQNDDPSRQAMAGVAIAVDPFESGTLMRLTATAPGSTPLPAKRLNDSIVTIADPGAGTGFPTTFFDPPAAQVSNPSRYQLGAPYTGGGTQVMSVTAGVDGDPNGQPSDTAFLNAVMSLQQPDPFFNVLCLPDVVRPKPDDPNTLQHGNAMTIYSAAAQICEDKHAFLLVDPPPNVTDVVSAEAWKSSGFTFASTHAGAYFPNILVDDPLIAGSIRAHPPSGAIAGVIARTDGQYGVWEAPAGTEAVLSTVYGPAADLSDDEQGVLNPIGLNVIRRFPIFGTVSFGSRTVDGADALGSDWKYVPVRRTGSYILRSLSEGLRWAVHKPNGESLWAQLRLSATSFMHGLFRQGAFKGTSARQAYFVLCDASTTTQEDIDQGVVNLVIGFAPLKPAEFVVITLRQIVQPAV